MGNTNNKTKMLIWVFAIIYLISPVDLIPGVPVDDLIVFILSAVVNNASNRIEDEYSE